MKDLLRIKERLVCFIDNAPNFTKEELLHYIDVIFELAQRERELRNGCETDSGGSVLPPNEEGA
jgi:hypothetical protein